MDMSPFGLRLLLPITERLQAELKHPLGLPLLCGDEPDDVFVQAFLYNLSMYIRREAELIFLFGNLTHILITRIIFHIILTTDYTDFTD